MLRLAFPDQHISAQNSYTIQSEYFKLFMWIKLVHTHFYQHALNGEKQPNTNILPIIHLIRRRAVSHEENYVCTSDSLLSILLTDSNTDVLKLICILYPRSLS